LSHPHTPAPARPSNGLGTAGFVVGLIGLLFSFLPVIGVIAWPLVILGVIFSAIGIARANKGAATNKGLAIAGLVLSVIGLVFCVLWAVAVGKAADDVREEANRPATIVYEVTGDATNVTVTYTSFGDGLSSSTEPAARLPWTKQLNVTGLAKGGSLTVATGPGGGTVTCKVTIDGKPVATNTASGTGAIASCTGF
jgi:heme/copper-type cytochrome/quinol oxidase subunit 2